MSKIGQKTSNIIKGFFLFQELDGKMPKYKIKSTRFRNLFW